MRIGIDARLYGLEHAGLGRYTMKLIDNVLKSDKKNHYVIFIKDKYKELFIDNPRVKVVIVDVPIYSLAEQVALPIIFAKEKLDLLHVPHFNAPLLYKGKMILTVHDLIKHHSKGKDTTTRNPGLYFFKRLGYLTLTSLIVRKANHIIVPTEYVKKDLIKKFHLPSGKIDVTYEAVDPNLKEVVLNPQEKAEVLQKYNLNQPFIVYTGSVYPHKNVEILIDAIEQHNLVKETDLELAIICARSTFWERLNKKIVERKLGSWIKLLGYLPDSEVSKIYSLALALVHPSKMEGFGLTGLEAMKLGVPVISSDATCLPEIYGDAALYFNPDKVNELVINLEKLIHEPELRESLSEKGYLREREYSWKKLGRETVAIYKRIGAS